MTKKAQKTDIPIPIKILYSQLRNRRQELAQIEKHGAAWYQDKGAIIEEIRQLDKAVNQLIGLKIMMDKTL